MAESASASASDAPSSAPSSSSTQLTQDSISALEYITQQEELESSARDILPYSFQRCTAPLGPLRQAVYACLTCAPLVPASQHGGICYSCSIQCHGSHNLVELFCKRNFTCDCGTTRMGATPCTLQKKTAQQPDNRNSYNHNFEGRFCECDQVYDVDAEEGTMFQCLVCEDWFHEKCIGEGRVPDQDDFEAFVCRECVGKNTWLARYVADKTAFLSTLETYPEINVDIETVEERPAEQPGAAEPSALPPPTTAGVKRSASADPAPSAKRVKLETESDCKWSALPPTPPTPLALFLKSNFRTTLCHCLDCQTLRLRTLPMIAAEEETYEPDQDDSDTDSLLDAGTRALSSLPRTQALDGIVAYQTLSAKLKGFFQGFVQTGKVVSEADVRGFFAEMKESGGVADSASAPAGDQRREESAK